MGLLRRPPEIGDGRETETSDAADAWVADLERLGARVIESRVPAARGDMWPLFLHEAAESHRDTFPSRADEYGPVIRPKLESGLHVQAAAVASAYETLHDWRQYEPDVDLYVSPCIGIDLPAEDADENEVRLPLSSFLRWVNLIGWAGLAIGNMQLIAPTDEIVLAAGLAWERR